MEFLTNWTDTQEKELYNKFFEWAKDNLLLTTGFMGKNESVYTSSGSFPCISFPNNQAYFIEDNKKYCFKSVTIANNLNMIIVLIDTDLHEISYIKTNYNIYKEYFININNKEFEIIKEWHTAFIANFENITISKQNKRFFIYANNTTIENYLYCADTIQEVKGILYGAVMAKCKRFKEVQNNEL